MNGIHGVAVLFGGSGMGTINRREDMGIIQFGAGAHIEIVGFRGIEHHIERLGSRAADRSGRQTGILIGIIGRIDVEMAIEDALEFEVSHGIFDGRTGL